MLTETVTANAGLVSDSSGSGGFYDIPLQNSNSSISVGDDDVSKFLALFIL